MIVTIDEVRAHLGAATADETYLTSLVTQIGKAVESFTRRSFTLAAHVDIVDGGGMVLILPYAPSAIISPATTSVTKIEDRLYSDAEEDLTQVDTDDEAGLIYRLSGYEWPAGKRRYRVTYGGGYNGAPDDVKLAVLTWIGEVFENRSGAKSESLGDHRIDWIDAMPSRVKMMLEAYQRILY